MRSEGDDKGQALVGHLADLRVCVVNSLLGLLFGAVICYWQSEKIFDFIRLPVQAYLPNQGLVYTGPLDKFLAHIKISLICGLILSCPFWLYQIWRFVAPGLYQKEQRYMVSFIAAGTSLFLAGFAFAYYVVLPMAFKFLFSFGGDIDKPMITIDHYLSFFTQMSLMFGLSFELPLILVILGMLEIISHDFLKRNRRYAVVALALVAAIITPPDLMSMIMMLVPLVALYEISVVIVGIVEKKRVGSRADP